jgi:hypothetical protein
MSNGLCSLARARGPWPHWGRPVAMRALLAVVGASALMDLMSKTLAGLGGLVASRLRGP